jgi:hypothetical protein
MRMRGRVSRLFLLIASAFALIRFRSGGSGSPTASSMVRDISRMRSIIIEADEQRINSVGQHYPSDIRDELFDMSDLSIHSPRNSPSSFEFGRSQGSAQTTWSLKLANSRRCSLNDTPRTSRRLKPFKARMMVL